MSLDNRVCHIRNLVFVGFSLFALGGKSETKVSCFEDKSISFVEDFPKYVKSCFRQYEETLQRVSFSSKAEYMGCYNLDLLQFSNYYKFSNKLTIDDCVEFCAAKSTTYVGLNDGAHCHCGGELSADSSHKVNENECFRPCPGDPRFTCGGDTTLSLYSAVPIKKKSEPVKVKTAEATTSSPKATPKPSTKASTTERPKAKAKAKKNSRIPVWNRDVPGSYLGCFKYNSNKTKLLVKMETSKYMTLEFCTVFCEVQGIRFSGVITNQCFCGVFNRKTKRRPDSKCNRRCTGNKKQFCGGKHGKNEYIQVYELKDPGMWRASNGFFLGCFEGSLKDRPFTRMVAPRSMSIEVCVDMCREIGYRFAGIQAGKFCACCQLHAEYPKSQVTQCNKRCSANYKQYCGGRNRIQLYSPDAVLGKFTPLGTYIGCFASLSKNMKKLSIREPKMTIGYCLRICYLVGRRYSGIYKNHKCYCGDTVDTSNRLADNRCATPCSSKDGTYCGGPNAYQIYATEFLLRKFYKQQFTSLPTDLIWG